LFLFKLVKSLIVEKKDIKKTKNEKFELFLDKIASEAIDFLSEKDVEIKDQWDLWKKTGDKACLKVCQDKIRENWKDFTVHGISSFDDKKNKVELRKKSDTDGNTSVGLLKEAGFNTDNVKFIKQGEFLSGYINLDTGFKKGAAGDKKRKTAWLDHHGGDITKKNLPAARSTYLFLRALHFFGKNEALKNLTKFVSQVDRAAFPEQEKLFKDSYKMVFGLYRKMNFDQLYDYFKFGKRPDDILSESDLDKFGLVEASKERKKKIENSIKEINRLKDDGFAVDTEFGKIIIDIDHKVNLGGEAAMAAGLDGYLLFDQKSESFFIVVKERDKKNSDLTKLNITQGIAVKNNMVMRPISEDRLNISLGEIIKKMGGNIKKYGKLEKTVNALEIRNNVFLFKPILSKDNKERDSYIAPIKGIFSSKGFFDKIAIFPSGFRPEDGKSCSVRVKYDSNPGERKGIYILEVLNNDNKLNKKNMSIEKPNLDKKESVVGVDNGAEIKIPPINTGNEGEKEDALGDDKGGVINEKKNEIYETKKEKMERLRYELKGLVLQKEPKKEERLILQRDIKNLEYDIQKHRDDKLEIMKDRPQKPWLKRKILQSNEPEKQEKAFGKLEEMRQKEAKKFLERKFRELAHAGKTKEAAELADKAASKEEIGIRTEKIREKIVNLEKEADALFNAGRKEEAKTVVRQIEDWENQIKNMKVESFDSRNIQEVQVDAEEAYGELKKHKEKLNNLKPFFKPSKKAYIGHVLTLGLLYGINVAYLYFKYRKPKLIEKTEYKIAKHEYQKTKKDLLVKLAQEITKEANYYAISEKLSRMIGDEKDKIRKNILIDIFSLHQKLGSPVPAVDLLGHFLYKRKVFINTSLAKIKSLAGLAQKTKLI